MIDNIFGRCGAAWALVLSALVAVVLALTGAERALVLMRHPVAGTVFGIFSLFGIVATCRRFRLSAAFLFHVGFALVAGGWLYDRAFGTEGGYLQLRSGQVGSVGGAFNLLVRDFRIDRWESGTVRQYTSDVTVMASDMTEPEVAKGSYEDSISVNHPLVKDGWWVYQSSYQETESPHSGKTVYFTVLECVRDIGLPYALFGGLMLVAGAFVLALKNARGRVMGVVPVAGKVRKAARVAYALAFVWAVVMLVKRSLATGHPPMQNMYEFLMCTLALLPVLTFISHRKWGEDTLVVDASMMAVVAMPVLFFMDPSVKKLMPALQSPFFVPHVGAYVIGYVLLVRAAFGAGRQLVGTGFFLLTVGLVLGAAWGKVCWGHWWQFDPKEMWSLATWFVYLAYFHLEPNLSERNERIFLAAGAVMVVLTLTWINLSRIFTGMHSYA